ncbi:helix-turn-helix domain-containing protein [Roseibium denhamense]|uniref:Helix-turn-helix n=1 Tax=Roseibium denhamense TaxID=76305 RepID=A0ABY1NDV1_9HYPH|nr:helix-turn-helix transcriptional regulator [Roseibium denhamense]SMP07285.1 Helix-turn-helix [Roseibium denhamense]
MADSKPKDTASTMTPQQFRAWRKTLGLKQKDAADRLGLKKRMIQYYEKGNRDGRPVEIPKSIRLACYALSQGIADYDGQSALELTSENAETD